MIKCLYQMLEEQNFETWQNVPTLVRHITIIMINREQTCMVSLLHYHKGNSWQITFFQGCACLKKIKFLHVRKAEFQDL